VGKELRTAGKDTRPGIDLGWVGDGPVPQGTPCMSMLLSRRRTNETPQARWPGAALPSVS
jgi:hypothetical protein